MRENNNNINITKWMISQTKDYLWWILILIVLNFLVAGITTYTAVQSKEVIDSIMSAQIITSKTVLYPIGIYLFFILCILILNYIIGILNDSLNSKVTLKMQNNLMEVLFEMDYEKINQLHTGKINTYLYSDIPYIANGILTIVPHFVNMFTRLAISIYILFIMDKMLAITLLFLGGLLLIGIKFIRKYSQLLYKLMQEKNAETRSFIQDSLMNNLAIRVFRKTSDIHNQIKKLQKNEYQIMLKRSHLNNFNSLVFSMIYQVGYIGVLIFGGYRISQGILTFGSLAALVQLSSQVQAPIANIAGLVPFYWGVITSAKRVSEITSKKQDIFLEPEMNFKSNTFEKIVAENLSFSYGNKVIIKDASFTIRKGDVVVITGESGSGKTTLLMLLMGILENSQIHLVTDDGKKYSPSAIKNSFVSFVPQKGLLFEGTVKDNISFFDETISESQIMDAAIIAEANSFILDLPEGYDYPISESGKSLSQGQAQRIAISRAICSDNELIILDEATSALDYNTEKLVLKNIATLNKTIIMITHRPEALKYATHHFHLQKGHLTYE